MAHGVRVLCALALALVSGLALAQDGPAKKDGAGDPTAVSEDSGKWFDADGNPTFKVEEDGTVDWYTYSGFRRYHAECHVCHGPAGDGSTYAPALTKSLRAISYTDFMDVVVNGRTNVSSAQENVMPAFGTNPNVMCYLDDIYIYLRARANGAVDRVRPPKRADKPDAFTEAEAACMGH
ncbi:MAG TPA: c-type cytochrome, methanol metabolism-related [Geminicoccus sp.]|uniref:c-type cytochrome, methanol metabolism-related n=1 Tax=Geminicoccus sp. TaxID=2024832 RepID=UPI002C4F2D4F|nr:c-type cytochrome, methanol metabolism-related [Geminicoccus sp.]HWL69585.1 c-type cytochrome, methanol metabolism-related [Geminicoccus sp.]